MAERRIEMMPLSSLLSQDRNARGHDPETLDASMNRFGYLQSVFLDERTGKILAGHGRRDQLAAKRDAGEDPPSDVIVEDGEWLVPVERGWSSRDDSEAEAAGIALNRVGEGRWREDELWAMLNDLSQQDRGLEGIGFTSTDLDEMLAAIDEHYGKGNIADALTPGDRLSSYLDSAIRTVILPFPATEYDEIVELLDRVQRAKTLPSHSDAVLVALRETAAGFAPDDDD